jgi:hypothetical protein
MAMVSGPAVMEDAQLLQRRQWLLRRVRVQVPVEDHPRPALRQGREIRQLEQPLREVAEQAVQQKPVRAALQVAQRHVREQHLSLAVRPVPGHDVPGV